MDGARPGSAGKALVEAHGFDHVLATRLHHDEDVAAVPEKANAPDSSWVAVLKSCSNNLQHRENRHLLLVTWGADRGRASYRRLRQGQPDPSARARRAHERQGDGDRNR
jgi:hypothetical protein